MREGEFENVSFAALCVTLVFVPSDGNWLQIDATEDKTILASTNPHIFNDRDPIMVLDAPGFELVGDTR